MPALGALEIRQRLYRPGAPRRRPRRLGPPFRWRSAPSPPMAVQRQLSSPLLHRLAALTLHPHRDTPTVRRLAACRHCSRPSRCLAPALLLVRLLLQRLQSGPLPDLLVWQRAARRAGAVLVCGLLPHWPACRLVLHHSAQRLARLAPTPSQPAPPATPAPRAVASGFARTTALRLPHHRRAPPRHSLQPTMRC